VNKFPELNPDGYSVKGCSYIYAPKGQAGEYAKLAANPYRGCGHKCLYCYVPSVLRMTREEFDAGAVNRPGFLGELIKDARKYKALGITEQVMLSFTTDPYHPGDTSLTRLTLEVLRDYGLAFCTLTKGGTRALRDIELFRPERDAFASTLTTLDDEVSRKWERDAALPGDRIEALKAFHARGVYTWVSLEPVFDTEATLDIIRETHKFVDLYKVGRINYSPLTKRIDWREFTQSVVELLDETGSDRYVKEDLQPYLPEGYRNELRRPQNRVAPTTA
jgi:DNA repair photolyase